MKRIDTVNARPDVNGADKPGFHINDDVSGQDATYLDPSWCNHVQEELANVIEGFGQALNPEQKNQVFTVVKGISDRTTLLEEFVENIVDFVYPVGIIIDFGIADFNPNTRYIGTTWVRHGEGKASVGLSTQEDDPTWTKTVGNTAGEYEHQLTIGELPKHKLPIRLAHEDGGTQDKTGFPATNASGFTTHSADAEDFSETNSAGDGNPLGSVGNNERHNNVQPSVVDARWRRTA